MPIARWLLPGLLLIATPPAAAAPDATDVAPMVAKPLESPASWIDPGDYPALARRFQMGGTTGFSLSVDTTGAPTGCAITQSSGFDVLDAATCDRLMANARFAPPRDRNGKPVAGVYANRVRWMLPDRAQTPMSERYASILLKFDRAGKILSCRAEFHFPASVALPFGDDICAGAVNSPLSLALGAELGGAFVGPSAEVEIRMADAFTPALRAQVLAPAPGYAQLALDIHQFTVDRDGEPGDCSYAEQRGSGRLVQDFCGTVRGARFDPPFAAFDANGVAHGWHIVRVLRKTGAPNGAVQP